MARYHAARLRNSVVLLALLSGVTPVLRADISLSPTTANVAASGGTGSVQVIATNQSNTWSASSDSAWLTFTSPTSGTGNGSISYSVAGNPSATNRVATVTVTASAGPSATLAVTEAGGTLSISPTSANVSEQGGGGTITVSTSDPSLQWTAVSSDTWLSISSGSSGIGPGSVQWAASANTSPQPRIAMITVTPLGGVGQVFTLNEQSSNNPRISFTPASASADAAGGSGAVQVSVTDQTISWTITSDSTWLTVSPASGTGNGSFQFTAAPNPTGGSRTATITGNPSKGPNTTMTVTQSGGTLTVSPTSANVPASGGTGSVSLTATGTALQWTATSNQSWLTLSPGSGTGSATVQWTAAANTSSLGRTATITVTVSGGSSQAVSIDQAGVITGTLTITPSAASIPPSVSVGTAQVTSTNQQLTWTASSDSPWLTITSGSPGTGNGTIQYTATGNTTASTRTGTITVTPANGTPVTLVITQAATTISITPTSATAPGSGGTGSFSFSTNNATLQWTAASSDPWLTLTSPASGTADATMTWAAASNPSTSSRTATITITPASGAALQFTVTQQGYVGTITVMPSPVSFSYQQLGPAPTDVQLTVSLNGAAAPFAVSATTSSGGNWLSVAPSSGTTPAVINVSAHPSGLAVGTYQGTITVTSASATNSPFMVPVTLTVTAAPVLTAQPNLLSFSFQQSGPNPGPQTVSLSSNGTFLDYTIVPDPNAPWLSATGTGPTPSTLTFTVNPTGLSPGSYQGTITINSAEAGNSPFAIPVTLTVSAEPALVVSALSLSLTYRQLDPLPNPLTLGVTSTGTNISFSADASPGQSWLSIPQVSRAIGQTPATAQVAINPTGLAPGLYQASVILTSTSAGNSPLTVPVSLTVLAGPTLTAQPQQLSFSLTQSVDTGASSSILLSSDTAINFTTSAQTTSGGNWLSVTPSGTQTNATLSVSVSIAGLSPGVYQGAITVTSAQATNSPLTIPVALTVSVQPRLIFFPTQLSFFYQLLSGSSPPDEFIAIGTLSGQAEVSATVSTTSGGNWLSTPAAGITTPGALQVGVNPTGLAAGTYAGTITLSSPGYAPATIPVSLRIASAPVLSAQPAQLSFSYQQNATAPSPQTVSVSSSSTPLPYNVAVAPGASWLSVTGGGLTPSSFSVSVNPQGLTPGTYSGTVTVTSTGAGNSPLAVPVQLTVTASPVLSVQPSSLSFDYTPQGSLPAAQTLHISSSQTLSFSTSISPPESWLTVMNDGTTTPGTLTVSVDPSGLTPGTYTASIVVSASGAGNSPVIVPVSLTVEDPHLIVPSPTQLTFSYQLLGPAPANQVMTISDQTLVVAASASTTSGGNWLSVTGGGAAGAIFSIMVDPTNLAPGTYQGSITLSAPNAGNSPVIVPVTFIVAAAPVLIATPALLSFSYQIGGSAPASAPFQVTSSGNPLTFQVLATTDSGGAWLKATSGGATSLTVTVSVDPTGLAPGSYTGEVNLTSATAGNSPLVVPVTFTVTTSTNLSASPSSLQFVAQQNGVAPAAQQVSLITGGPQIAVTYMGSPGANWLSFTGDPAAPGNITVNVSQAGLTPGTYSAVILVQSAFAANSPLSIPITLQVTAVPVFTASPSILAFTYTITGPKPALQTFTVTSSGAAEGYNVSVVPGPSWLFSSGSGTTPGTVSVTVDPGLLTAGQYQGTIQISPTGGSAPIQVQVTLTVSALPLLSSLPSSLTFAYQVNGPLPSPQVVVVSSNSGVLSVSVNEQPFSGGPWLNVTGGGNTPAALTATVSPAGLTSGVYKEQINVTATGAGNSLSIPVTLIVSSAPTLTASPSALSFAALVNATPPNQQITLTSSDGSPLPIGAVVSSSGSFPLVVTSTSTTTPATLTVSAVTTGVSAGVYQSSIIVTSSSAGNSPLTIPVTLTLSAQPSLVVAPPSAYFAYAIGTTPPGPATLSVGSTSTSLSFNTSVAPGAPWLSVAGSGSTPAAIQITVNPASLSAGSYYGTVLVTSTGAANSVVAVPVTLVVSGQPLLITNPLSLTFSTTASGSAAPQALQILSTGASLSFTASVSPATPWLSASGSGGTPQSLTVSVSTAGLSPGTYQGAVQILAPAAADPILNIPVTLVVSAAAVLAAGPSQVTFSYQPGGTPPPSQNVSLTVSGQPAGNAQSTVGAGTPWLSVTPGTGSVSITANPTGLLPGTYNSTVLVTSSDAANSPLSIPITLVVKGTPVFDISQDSLAFTAVTSQSPPMTTVVTLGTGSNPPVDYTLNVTASTWLTVTPSSGMTPATVTVTVDPTGLRAGNYAGSVMISSSGNMVRTVPVNLTVADTPTLGTSPPFLAFSYSTGGNPPSPVNVYIARFGANISVLATPNVPWITVNPSTPSTSGPIQVTVSPTGLTAGVYQGLIQLAIIAADGTATPVKQIPVTLYVNQPADPMIYAVVSGMSFLNTPLAPGLIFTIFGTGLGPETPVGMQIQPDGTISQTLGGVQVLVNGIPCPLMYVSATQINAIAPYSLFNASSETAQVAVRFMGFVSEPIPMAISPTAPGLFANPPAGAGMGAILNQDQTVNTTSNPAAAGTIITLFGGGGGQTSPQGIDGLVTSTTVLPKLMMPVSVTIGGVAATDISYAGAAPTFLSGVIQVNVRIPATVSGGSQPVVLQIGNTSSQQGLFVSVK